MQKKGLQSRILTAAAILFCGCFLLMPASASVIGSLDLGSGVDTVTVSATSIFWNGPFMVSGGTTLTYDGGTALPIGSSGDLVNLSVGTIFPVSSFMTFSAAPSLKFNLSSIGPGSSNINCAGVTTIGSSCSVFAGSPFLLTLTSTGTTVELAAQGTATDGTVPISNWIGEFSTTITTLAGFPLGTVITPADIQGFFLANPNGVITSPYSGTFVATLVPEPTTTTMSLVGGGLIFLGLQRRRRLRN